MVKLKSLTKILFAVILNIWAGIAAAQSALRFRADAWDETVCPQGSEGIQKGFLCSGAVIANQEDWECVCRLMWQSVRWKAETLPEKTAMRTMRKTRVLKIAESQIESCAQVNNPSHCSLARRTEFCLIAPGDITLDVDMAHEI